MLIFTVIFAPYWCQGFVCTAMVCRTKIQMLLFSFHLPSEAYSFLCWSSMLNPYLSRMTTASVSFREGCWLPQVGTLKCVDWKCFFFMFMHSKCFSSVLHLQNEKYLDYLKASNVQNQQNHTSPTWLNVSSEAYLLGNTPKSFMSYMFSPPSSTDR